MRLLRTAAGLERKGPETGVALRQEFLVREETLGKGSKRKVSEDHLCCGQMEAMVVSVVAQTDVSSRGVSQQVAACADAGC